MRRFFLLIERVQMPSNYSVVRVPTELLVHIGFRIHTYHLRRVHKEMYSTLIKKCETQLMRLHDRFSITWKMDIAKQTHIREDIIHSLNELLVKVVEIRKNYDCEEWKNLTYRIVHSIAHSCNTSLGYMPHLRLMYPVMLKPSDYPIVA